MVIDLKSTVLLGPGRTDDTYRFLSKMLPSKSNPGCIEIDASKTKKGYYKFRFGGKQEWAHRVAFRIYRGRFPNPETPFALHKCNYPGCVNPLHLYEGTPAQNIKDRDNCGRTSKGVHRPDAKLTEEKVREIRRLYATGQHSFKKLGSMFGISGGNVSRVVWRKRWKHVV